jgi:hypothetical protein
MEMGEVGSGRSPGEFLKYIVSWPQIDWSKPVVSSMSYLENNIEKWPLSDLTNKRRSHRQMFSFIIHNKESSNVVKPLVHSPLHAESEG